MAEASRLTGWRRNPRHPSPGLVQPSRQPNEAVCRKEHQRTCRSRQGLKLLNRIFGLLLLACLSLQCDVKELQRPARPKVRRACPVKFYGFQVSFLSLATWQPLLELLHEEASRRLCWGFEFPLSHIASHRPWQVISHSRAGPRTYFPHEPPPLQNLTVLLPLNFPNLESSCPERSIHKEAQTKIMMCAVWRHPPVYNGGSARLLTRKHEVTLDAE